MLTNDELKKYWPGFFQVQQAIDDMRKRGGGRLMFDLEKVEAPQPLNARDLDHVYIWGLNLVARFAANMGRMPMIDWTGSNASCFDWTILRIDEKSQRPACGVLAARPIGTVDSHENILSHVDTQGPFGTAGPGGSCLAIIGAEKLLITDTSIFRFGGRKGAALFTSTRNDYGIESPFGPIATGVSNAGPIADGGSSFCCDEPTSAHAEDERYVIDLGYRTTSASFRDCYVTAKKRGTCDATIHAIDPTNITVEKIHDEAKAAKVFFLPEGVCNRVSVRDTIIRAGLSVPVTKEYREAVAGIMFDQCPHQPDPKFWTGEPTGADDPIDPS